MTDFERATLVRRASELESFLAALGFADDLDVWERAQAASHAQELFEHRRDLAADAGGANGSAKPEALSAEVGRLNRRTWC